MLLTNCYKSLKLLSFSVVLFVSGNSWSREYKAANGEEALKIAPLLQAGDTLTLLNGVWKDAQLVFTNKGTQEQHITIRAEQSGKVVLSGKSSLKLGGSYIDVFGLYFTNGSSDDAVICFRTDPKNLATHCRVSNSVIFNYNPPARLKENNWIAFYGRNNRFDHNYVADKKNLGATLVVELNDEENQRNFHRIDHNYFGRRDRLGANGGETMRIGSSTFSRTSSNTIIENNFFEHCNGEVEIISIKSGNNIVKGNIFRECEGSVVLRHGNSNVIEGNRFIGNNKPMTGGVRVINAAHRIVNNYFYKLAGERFRSALTIMNAVPNSPINRYDPVRDVVIAGNTFVDCQNIELCAGKDYERTATPEHVLFAGNTFYNSAPLQLFHVHDDISGIRFTENYSNHRQLNSKLLPLQLVPGKFPSVTGVPRLSAAVQTFLDANSLQDAESDFGPDWFNAGDLNKAGETPGRLIKAAPGSNTLYEAVRNAQPNDTIQLSGASPYYLSKTIEVKFPLHFKGEEGASVRFEGEKGGFSFFSIENGGSLYLNNISFDGLSRQGIAESFIRTSKAPTIEHYKLFVDGCTFLNLTDGRKHALKVYPGTFADSIVFTNCLFNDITGDVISIAAEKEDKGYYNAENIVFRNCVFNKILMGAIDIYRGGNDESTTGPFVTIDHCTFNNVGNTELGFAVRLHGVQYSSVTSCLFNNSGKSGRAIWFEDFGWTKNSVSYCNLYNSGKVQSFYGNVIKGKMSTLQPKFMNERELDFRLAPNPLLQGSDKKDIGAIYQNKKLHFNK